MPNREDLKVFLAERLLELDPTLNDAPGSPMYTSVINPLLNRLGVDPYPINIEEFVTARLREDPLLRDLDIYTEGSSLKDILARALIVLLEPLQMEGRFVSTQQSFLNIENLTNDEADALLANLLVTRNPGEVSRGVVRVYYSAPRPVSVDAGIIFYTATGIRFIPSETQTRTESEFVQEGGLFYVEFDVQSEVPHIGTRVAAGTIKFSKGLSGVVRVTNPSKMTGGVTEQSKEAALTAASDAVSARNMNNKRGIRRVLFELFPELQSVELQGYRDPFMQRDILRGNVTVAVSEYPGKILSTAYSVLGWNLVEPDGAIETRPTDPLSRLNNWPNNVQDDITNVVALKYLTHDEFLDGWEAVESATFVRLIHFSNKWDSGIFSRPRRFSSYSALDVSGNPVDYSDVNARLIRLVLTDFTIEANGADASTSPNSNDYADQGPTFKLKDSNGNWRGAPLPYTDVIDLGGGDDLSGYTAQPGRDFLYVRGLSYSTYPLAGKSRVYPIRRKLSDTKIQVYRADSFTNVRAKLGSGTVWRNDPAVMMQTMGTYIRAYGSPALGDPTVDFLTMFDGVTTVADGQPNMGGVALYSPDPIDPLQNFWIKIAPHASRPNGWLDYGVIIGDFISLAAFSGTTVAPTGSNLFDWWQWARIEQIGSGEAVTDYHYLLVRGVWPEKIQVGPTSLLGYTNGQTIFSGAALENVWGFPSGSEYRLHWSIFRGEIEALMTNGNLNLTYTDLAFAPAHNTTGETVDATPGKWNAEEEYYPFIDAGPDSAILRQATEYFALGSNITATPNGAPYDNRHAWAIFRLDEPWLAKTKEGSAETFVEDTPHIEVMELTSNMFFTQKYRDVFPIDLKTTLQLPVHSPFTRREWKWTDPGLVTATYTSKGGSPNDYDMRGFIVGREVGIIGQTTAQLLAATEDALTDPKITVSNIPGSFPFTETYGVPVTVNDNEVHLGGCVDAYVKGSVSQEVASFFVSPGDISETDTSDVVFSAINGLIPTLYPSLIYSPDLSSKFTEDELSGLRNYSLVIIDCGFPDIIGRAYRIVGWDHSAGYVRVAEDVNTSGFDIASITFRILGIVTTDAAEPHRVVQVGSDLSVSAGSSVVTSVSGFTWSSSLLGQIYLEISGGDNEGVYFVLNKDASKLTLDKVMQHTESSVVFRVLQRTSGIDYPLVRVTKVDISSGDSPGYEIPYRRLVDCVGESFSGLNNDPVEVLDNTLVLRKQGTYAGLAVSVDDPAHADGTFAYATLISTDASFSWRSEGIIKYDVVEIYDQEEEQNTYFWVRDPAAGTAPNEERVLLLDRIIDSSLLQVNGLIGKPSVGEVRVYALQPNFFGFGPNTVIRTKDRQQSFRPSPAEEYVLYRSSPRVTDALLTPSTASSGTLVSTSDDYQKLGVAVGDKVQILTVVMTSATILAATAADMSVLVGGVFRITVDGTLRSVLLTAVGGGLTLDNIISQVNASLGNWLRVVKVADGGDFKIKIYSQSVLVVADSTIGVVLGLGLTLGQTNTYVESAYINISDISYNAATEETTLTLTDTDGNDSLSVAMGAVEVFIEITRPEVQGVLPGNMLLDSFGLYYYDITCTSRKPLTTVRLAENTQLDIEGYDSFGYELIPRNNVLTFSDAEQTDIVFTPVFLPPASKNFNEAIVVAESTVDVTYDRAQIVQDVQTAMLSDFNRVVDMNPLARHFFPGYPYITADIEGGVSLDFIVNDFVQYLATLYPNKLLEKFALTRILFDSNVTAINSLEFFYLVHNEDRSVTIVRADSVLTLMDVRYHIMEDVDNLNIRKG